jgi:hypothetical protein
MAHQLEISGGGCLPWSSDLIVTWSPYYRISPLLFWAISPTLSTSITST